MSAGPVFSNRGIIEKTPIISVSTDLMGRAQDPPQMLLPQRDKLIGIFGVLYGRFKVKRTKTTLKSGIHFEVHMLLMQYRFYRLKQYDKEWQILSQEMWAAQGSLS